MFRRLRSLTVAAVVLTAACSDNQLAPDRSGASAILPGRVPAAAMTLPDECADPARAQSAIDSLLPQLFGPGGGRRGKAQGYSNNIDKGRRTGQTLVVEANVDSLINYTLTNYYDDKLIGGQSTATQDRVLKLFYLLYCSNGITPVPDLSGIFSAANTVLIRNGTPTTVVSDPGEESAVKVDQGDVPSTMDGQPFFGTFVSVYQTTNPLPTSLDWYGQGGYKAGAYEFVANPEVTFTDPVLAGVCIEYDDAVVTSPGDLRIAHAVEAGYVPVVPGNTVLTTAGGTIEIGAPVSLAPLGLSCPELPYAAGSALGRVLQLFAQLVLPDQLAAGVSGGGTGGQVVKFSPFAAVDTKLLTTSTGPSSPLYIPVGSSDITAPVTLTVRARVNAPNGTPIDNIPVSFVPGAIGGFSPALVNTGLDGTAASTWTIVDGTNTGTATPAQAPLGFVPAAANFSVTAIQILPLSITAPASPLSAGVQGVAYPSTTFTATGGIGSYSWSVVSGALPAGLSLSAAGVLTGTPSGYGSFSFTVEVSSGPVTATGVYSLDIQPPPVVITTTSPLPNATAGVPYSKTFQATGGIGGYTWSVTAGALPAGLTLSAAGVLSGTPTTAGTANFTVEAVSGAQSASQSFSLTVQYPTSVSLAFQPGPSASQCYALNAIMTPTIAVKVTAPGGQPLAGVQVDIVAEVNNGAKVATSQPFAISNAAGLAVFDVLSINKNGGYRLVASTTAPWPTASVRSGRFNISPSCP